ncbi:hypothetical protein PRIPAC_71119 [Pristionchus pacificus]|uniref:MSP domain-containing protein n=1 Tax=Pristionchus pacificus TaxID=54126 RepID=A0A2A6CA23_PRIPA|nr:hypothetical protein PRIPAC_70644 [Pristionchus pacificus]KAF8381977.1 hypothetical protein PRIPAC_71119 [Pristionchus pacificus]|eukprot:PDM74940.1 MSP domain-containing protein [Pristionchus pacificus]
MVVKKAAVASDIYVWTNDDPDLEIVEPPMRVSINKNSLQYGRKDDRPPQKHTISITNHGDSPVAFKIQCSDNVNYFVNEKYGLIAGHVVREMPDIRGPNFFDLWVWRRPCTCTPQAVGLYEQRSDVLQILIAPALSFSVPPASYFHHSKPYETLRASLIYTGKASDKKANTACLNRSWRHWNTWERELKELKDKKAAESSVMQNNQ